MPKIKKNRTPIPSGIIVTDTNGQSYTADAFVEQFSALLSKAIYKTVGRRETETYTSEDIWQDVMFSCLLGVRTYDPDRGVALSTFLYQAAIGYTKNFLREHGHPMKLLRGTKECEVAIRRRYEVNEWAEKEARLAETARELGFNTETTKEAFRYLQEGRTPMSLHFEVEREGNTVHLMDLVPAPQYDSMLDRMNEQMMEYIRYEATDRERVLIEGHIFGMSQTELAGRLNYSQVHVSRLQRRAIRRMIEVLQARRKRDE